MDEIEVVEVAPEIIAEASRFGWVSKEKFRGSEAEWVDAETFVQRGREINPILKANNERLKHEIDLLHAKLDESTISVKEFKKFQTEAFERKEQDYKAQLSALKDQKKEAIQESDGERVIAIDDAIDEIKEAQRQAKEVVVEKPVPPAPIPDPMFTAWMNENTWYTRDRKLMAVADAIGEEIKQENQNLSGREFLDEVAKRVREEMPHKFDQPKARISSVEGSNGQRQATGKKKGYDQLPADAKAACDDFVKRGFLTREEYVSKYDWS